MKHCRLFGFDWALAFLLFPQLFQQIFFPVSSWGAPCCARSSAVPILISGDDEAQFNFGASFASVVAQAGDEGITEFFSNSTSETIRTLRLEGATLLTDRFQIGAGIGLINYSFATNGTSDSSTGLGDLRLNTGYEFLPAWSYSKWKPQGFVFTAFSLPTGRSRYESQSPTGTDVTGNGFYSISVGTLLIKKWGNWDVFLVPEIHYSFSRTFRMGRQDLSIDPGLGGSIGIGGGFSPGGDRLRLGIRFQPRIDQPRIVFTRDSEINRGWVSNCDTGFDAAYLLGSTDTLMISYTDQTLLGYAANTLLNRTFGLSYQHRWER